MNFMQWETGQQYFLSSLRVGVVVGEGEVKGLGGVCREGETWKFRTQ